MNIMTKIKDVERIFSFLLKIDKTIHDYIVICIKN